MPRNPTVDAVEQAKAAQRNYLAAERGLKKAVAARKVAMTRCVNAGMSKVATAKLFNVSPNAIGNVTGPAVRTPTETRWRSPQPE